MERFNEDRYEDGVDTFPRYAGLNLFIQFLETYIVSVLIA